MIRLLNAYFPTRTLFLGVSEACLVAIAFVGATIVRLGANDAAIVLSYEQGFLKIIVVSAAFVTCMYYFDLYDSSIMNNRREVLTRMIQVQGTLCVLLAGLYFVFPPLGLGRGIFLIGFLLGAAMLFLWRRMFMTLNILPQFAERILIFGDGVLAESLKTEMRARPELGMRVVGQVGGLENSDGKTGLISKEEQVGAILDMVKVYKPDRIIVTFGERRGKLPVYALLYLKSHGVTIEAGDEVYEAVTGKIPLESLRLGWLLFSPGFSVSRPLVIYKRIASVVLSAVGLFVALPLMALTALAIRMDSAGPAIFRQKRLGQNGEIFTLYKFRTMFEGADLDENHPPAELTDSRFTRLGRLLRRTHLDELPQLVNILRGDMHFVGPRPFVPNQEQACVEKIPYYSQRWVVKPGATGWAQVNRGYNATIEENREKLAYDLFYIKNISVGLDLLILFKTAKILILGRGGR